ncbi:hypothetical protein GGTG_02601 [Gaeumannomyces tritici R3-111a-1]|uniref:Uncharacterized protein n=1 Tax=Gaeumannomyces tritici (strain R3-111a-1) TaxID=644352 RepID=J3NMU2_GAET3|nr:hypothetical protein GGTG_02601 [Gaeumannomyces tritici R3-111a-1]EJT77493.1 hypothetical protein GGTG_02601 [Gaeumannomyces tritici R3-111a-1]
MERAREEKASRRAAASVFGRGAGTRDSAGWIGGGGVQPRGRGAGEKSRRGVGMNKSSTTLGTALQLHASVYFGTITTNKTGAGIRHQAVETRSLNGGAGGGRDHGSVRASDGLPGCVAGWDFGRAHRAKRSASGNEAKPQEDAQAAFSPLLRQSDRRQSPGKSLGPAAS